MFGFPALVRRNLRYFWRTHLAVSAAVAIAVGVLTGALLVGDSVRGSLRELFLARLGRTDHVITAATFFRESLAEDLSLSSAPLIAFEGMVSNEKTGLRRAGVQVFGIDERFWSFHRATSPKLEGRNALLTESLAQEIGASEGDSVLLRVEKPSDVSRSSLHGRKEDASRSIRLTARSGLAETGLPEFSVFPQQESVPAVFVPLARLQRDLELPGRVNTILISGSNREGVVDALRAKASLEDLSLRVRELEGRRVLSVESSALVLSEPMVLAVESAARELSIPSFRILTYLANSLRIDGRETPYSLVSAVDAGLYPGIESSRGIVLNSWAGEDLGAQPGDRLEMEFYVWEDEGRIATRSASFTVDAIVPMDGIAADRDLAPSYPGISETEKISDWEPPFPIDLRKVRDKDEDYWDRYRTTPKAFIPLARGQEIWPVRQGKATSIRLSSSDGERVKTLLRQKLDPLELGFSVIAAREEGLRASSGATDFGQYFVYFSYFLVVAAVLLTGLFFKLGVEQRHREVGTLFATGFTPAQVRRLFLWEGFLLSVAGAVLGTVVAVGYAAVILHGLRTWWVDAVGTRLLTLHVGGISLVAGIAGGVLSALLATWLTLRYLRRVPARSLLAGPISSDGTRTRISSSRVLVFSFVALVASFLLLSGSYMDLESDVLGFFGAGNLVLVSVLGFLWVFLNAGSKSRIEGTGLLALARLGFRSATHRPGRSLVAVALIAFATFTIVAVDAFRKTDASLESAGGYPLAAESLLPLLWDPNTEEGRNAFNLPYPSDSDFVEMKLETFRLRRGDDASCLNLYRPQNPRVLAPTGDFLERGGFRFADSMATTSEEESNPWRLLKKDLPDGAVPVIGDANSMTYVLHLRLGEDFLLPRAGKTPLRLRLVATVEDSIFQGELLMSEESFLRYFPEVEGFRFFLVDVKPENAERAAAVLEERLSDFGLDVQTTASKLASFHRVENTYLSTFQSLGGLGLLLGTFGLAAVLLRNVLERRRELALLRAVGYRPWDVSILIFSENALLLVLGLAAGSLSALLAIAPAVHERGFHFGSTTTVLFLAAVLVAGAVSSLLAASSALRAPLLQSLRAE